jgi:ABC-type branched-subunit amino acid transport system permease subunit
MNELLTALASGVVAASLYVTYGLGLAVVYRASGVLNFAHGAIGAGAAYVMLTLLHSLPYPLAALVSIAFGTAFAVTIQVVIVRALPSHSAEVVGIATLGVLIITEGVLLGVYGGEAKALPSPLATHTLFQIGSYHVQTSNVLDVGVAAGASLLLGALLFRTRVGLEIRAVSEGSRTAAMFGVHSARARMVVWAASGALAATAALLITPSNFLTPDFLTTFLIGTFVAVVLGGFESIVGVIIGGLVFGVIQSLFSVYVTTRLSSTLSFGVILVVLIFLPYGVVGHPLPRIEEPRLPREFARTAANLAARIPRPRARQPLADEGRPLLPRGLGRWSPIPVALIGIALTPLLSASWLSIAASVAGIFIAVLGVDLIYGHSGQLSIGQSGFMLAGSYVTAVLQLKAGVPYLAAAAIAVVAGAIVGAAFGLPAARLKGVYLAVVTLAFALAVPEVISYFASVTGGDSGIAMRVPSWIGLGDDRLQHLYIFAVVVAGVVATVVAFIARSALGRSWRAVRDSELAAAAYGLDPTFRRVAAFAAGSALCSLSGAVLASNTGFLSPQSFTLWTSIYLVVAVVVGGRASTFGALIGAAFIIIIPDKSSSIPELSNLLLGVALLVVLVLWPNGIRQILFRAARWATTRKRGLRPPGGESQVTRTVVPRAEVPAHG